MKVILNIGLRPPEVSLPDATLCDMTRRLRVTLQKVVDTFHKAYLELPTNLEFGAEPCLIVAADVQVTLRKEFTTAMHFLAKDLNQDCIAVWFEDFERGVLLGPHATAYGEFDKSLFRFPKRKVAL